MHVLAAFDFVGRLLTSVGHALDQLLGFVPNLIGAIVLIVLGWIVSDFVAMLVVRLLRAAHFDRVTEHAGIDALAERFGMAANGNMLLASVAKWFIRLIFLVAAFNALNIPAISNILDAITLWLPSFIAALLIIIIGAALARVAGEALEHGLAGTNVGNPRMLGRLLQFAIVAFVLFIALEQIGVGNQIITTFFGAVMLALAIGCGLAFGLGGRDTAKRIVDGWYEGMSSGTVVPSVGNGVVTPAIPAPNPRQKANVTTTPNVAPDGINTTNAE